MLVTTQDGFVGHEITETLGLVRGNVVRARHVGKDIIASLRKIVGGEVVEYTKLMAESREQALDRMLADAERQGADGVATVRFVTSMISQGTAELLAYGTAVKLRRSA